MTPSRRDREFMKKALRLARLGRGWTSPNPMVGAVVVKDDTIVGSGYHYRAGEPHAEVNALESAGNKALGGTLYVTLEPCNHYGRTPPCTHAILKAGIARVVIGMRDPNPHVDGGGAQFLANHGVDVTVGVLEDQCRLLNQPFIKYITTGLPFVVLKVASTLDGHIATRTGDARWITNEQSRRFVHRLRHELDAVIVGIGTALADDPLLTCRLKGRRVRQPVRIVLDTELRLPTSAQLVKTAREVPVWVACGTEIGDNKIARLKKQGVEVIKIPSIDGRIELRSLLRELGRRNITSVLVEGGAQLLGSFLDNNLADMGYFFFAPKIIGDPEAIPMISGKVRLSINDALRVYNVRVRRFKNDIMIVAWFRPEIY